MSGIRRADRDTLIPGFTNYDLTPDSGHTVRFATGGDGPPLLLLHGHPQTHATWRYVAPALARHHTVVTPDLRGYGDSAKPASDPEHLPYSKRVMAAEQVDLMRTLGYDVFSVVGHDRGGRVAHRMALDHPDVVRRLAVLDIAPTATMYRLTDRTFATRYFWWFFLIQPEPLPETMIAGATETYLRAHLRGQSGTDDVPDPELVEEYLRCYQNPKTIHAVCEDYRAAATIDLDHDEHDRERGHLLRQPLLALWGEHSTIGQLYDVLNTWREVSAGDVTGGPIPCGHLLQEERPNALTTLLHEFLL